MIPTHEEIRSQMAAEGGQPGTEQQPAQQVPAELPSDDDFYSDFLGVEQQEEPSAAPVQQTPSNQQQQQDPSLEGLDPETLEAIAAAKQQPGQQPQQSAPPLDRAQAEQQAIEQLATGQYALSEQEAKDLIAEPDKVLPNLAAKIHVAITQQIAQMIGQYMPLQVEAVVKARMQAQRAEQEFFGKYSNLKDPRFRPVVLQSLKLAAQVSEPGTSKEEVAALGAQIAVRKLKLKQQQQQQQQPAPQQRQQPPAPFRPATANAAPLNPQPSVSDDNIFAQLADDPDW